MDPAHAAPVSGSLVVGRSCAKIRRSLSRLKSLMSFQLHHRGARWLALVLLLFATRATPSAAQGASASPAHGPLRADEQVRGWTILSDRESDDLAVIAAARRYDIDHLELSHQVVMDLNDVRDERKRALVNRLTDSAHAAGIREVVVWDHALYEL